MPSPSQNKSNAALNQNALQKLLRQADIPTPTRPAPQSTSAASVEETDREDLLKLAQARLTSVRSQQHVDSVVSGVSTNRPTGGAKTRTVRSSVPVASGNSEAARPSVGKVVPEPLRKPAIDDVRQLLAHLDAQEAGMLALKNLLQDLGNSAIQRNTDRRLRTRMDAAEELFGRLNSDCVLIVERIAESVRLPTAELSIRRIIELVRPFDAELSNSLTESRHRLIRVVRQVHQVSQTTSWIISSQRQRNQIEFQLATGRSDSERYDSTGRMAVNPESVRFGTRS
ncbi:MAG: hypothetical protein KDA81_19550 [Planctomycetaceae bacterium]|nr:hypothetical protein [Planctomycetaceae bacterium]